MTGMSGALLPALGGAMVIGGLIGVVVGFRKVPPAPPGPSRKGPLGQLSRRGGLVDRVRSMSKTMRAALLVGFAVGVVVALLTGWLIAIIVLPGAAVGLPVLLSTPPSSARIDRLEAMEEWARSLSSGLTAGRGLDQALIKSLRSTPEVIKPDVARLVNRLDAHWSTERALRAFAEDLNDATGDLLVYYLILSARRRGTGLASVIEEVAESVAADVRARRQIDADQAKPRTTARYVTVFTIGVLAFLALTGEYIEPYGSPLGQVVLAMLLTAYVATLAWMRSMATAKPLPRFLNRNARDSARDNAPASPANPLRPRTATSPRPTGNQVSSPVSSPVGSSVGSAATNGNAVTR